MTSIFDCENCARKNPRPEHVGFAKQMQEECKKCIKNNDDPDSIPSKWLGMDYELEPIKDMVDHPNHYQSTTGLEAIDVIEAFTSDISGIEAFCTGNAIKYLCRWKKKNGIEDLRKAEWYLNRLIRHIEILEAKNQNKKENI